MGEWLERTSKLTIPGESFFKLRFETPDEGGKIGLAIEDGLMRIYEAQKATNLFAIPKLILMDTSVPEFAGGMLGLGASTCTPEKPIIHIPPSQTGKMWTTPPVPSEPMKKTVLIKINLEQAAIILHEVNHGTHRCVNKGVYKQPYSSVTVKKVDQNLKLGSMSESQSPIYKFANEVETYWLSCCDAAKYQMDKTAIMAIKTVNNQNLVAAGYAYLGPEQAKYLQELMNNPNASDEDKMKAWSKVFNVEDINVTQLTIGQNPLDGPDDEDEPQPDMSNGL